MKMNKWPLKNRLIPWRLRWWWSRLTKPVIIKVYQREKPGVVLVETLWGGDTFEVTGDRVAPNNREKS